MDTQATDHDQNCCTLPSAVSQAIDVDATHRDRPNMSERNIRGTSFYSVENVCSACVLGISYCLRLCTRIRQGVVNRLIGCELRTYGLTPLQRQARQAAVFAVSNRLLKRIAFRWWKRCLCLLAHGGYRC